MAAAVGAPVCYRATRRWSGPVSRILSWAFISLGRRLPAASSGQPGTQRRRASAHPRRDSPPIWPCSGRGLASRCVTTPLVRSYRTFSPLLCFVRLRRTTQSGVVSVPLSVASPRLGVTQRPALWSPDFPRPACANRERLAHSIPIVAQRQGSGSRDRERRWAVTLHVYPPAVGRALTLHAPRPLPVPGPSGAAAPPSPTRRTPAAG